MRLLMCGVNPSLYSADAGVGYARPGNRFWTAALAAGIVDRDRDPIDALLGHGVGMTDFVKRPTRTAAEVTVDEYRAGYARVERLVEWLQPGAVCFVGLSGWRTVVDPKAMAGLQVGRIGRTAGLRDALDQRAQCPHIAGRAHRPPPVRRRHRRRRLTRSVGRSPPWRAGRQPDVRPPTGRHRRSGPA